jgi:Na+/H+ antiporter NhaD/arsenite permease-like protein
LVGDPPNVLIGSAAGFSFNDFLIHALPIVAVAWVVALFLLRFLFREELSKRPHNAEALMSLNPAESLDDPKNAQRVLIVLSVAILLFFVHHILHISPSFIAVGAAAVALLWVQPDIKQTFEGVELSVLIFFSALFVMVGGLEAAGVLDAIVRLLEGLSRIPPVWFGVSLIWIVILIELIR